MTHEGTFEAVYNGPGPFIQQQLTGRTHNGLPSGLMALLRRINATDAEEDRILRR